ncbi:hypothetical protein EXIGLDRAFT_778023 [Exidia glandulosa HHB12029]|uniref:Uncharacterized protein n=1 Tax=Exidia glandulosa HHB12029 TaxID=1314781 RepID=A0A165CRI4_EXIGL|nr:hypothetical protein EXIGLDRAFT_778023 [Exidia glandulosa HHB12029]
MSTLPFDAQGRLQIVRGRRVPDLAPSSALPSNADTTSTRVAEKRARAILRTLIAADDGRDFVRGVRTAPHQATHLVNAFRRSRTTGRSREAHRDLRAALEEYLTALGFNLDNDFHLDGVHNLLLLEPTIHVALDLYSLIVFAPTYEYLLLLHAQLQGT